MLIKPDERSDTPPNCKNSRRLKRVATAWRKSRQPSFGFGLCPGMRAPRELTSDLSIVAGSQRDGQLGIAVILAPRDEAAISPRQPVLASRRLNFERRHPGALRVYGSRGEISVVHVLPVHVTRDNSSRGARMTTFKRFMENLRAHHQEAKSQSFRH